MYEGAEGRCSRGTHGHSLHCERENAKMHYKREMMMLMMMFITIFDVYARERERFFLILCEGFNCGKRSEEDGALSAADEQCEKK